MNRNAESHFAQLPRAEITRSRFDRSHDHKTTFNAGELVPILCEEVLPGDTVSMDTSFVMRMSTPIHPTMDNAFFDYYYFFVPSRLVWEHFEEFMGANKTGHWTQPVTYTIPQIQLDSSVSSNRFGQHSIADYFGIPTQISSATPGSGNIPWTFSALPIRSYCLIWNEWFRDENLQDPIVISLGDATTIVNLASEIAPAFDITLAEGGGCRPAPVAKYHDYFTSALPEPQKGDPVDVGILSDLPVVTKIETHDVSGPALTVRSETSFSGSGVQALVTSTNASNPVTGPVQLSDFGGTANENSVIGFPNLWADVGASSVITINALRQAFQLQKLLEKDARGGTRYIELLKVHFGVTSPDARLQRPEYLGGARVPVNVSQVLQTSSTDSISPQGNTAAYSLTADKRSSFTHSFVEHGYLIGVGAVRTDHTYQQGLEKFWSRKSRFDFYWSVFANIGEQPVFNKEIYLQPGPAGGGISNPNDEVFGYQEAWADYRYKPSRVSGQFRSNAEGTLDSWHYADNYSSLPILSDTWIRETDVNIDRTLAVQSSVSDQFIADFYFKAVWTRPMPMYSIPGLVDHH